jgi:hypothetical protein
MPTWVVSSVPLSIGINQRFLYSALKDNDLQAEIAALRTEIQALLPQKQEE